MEVAGIVISVVALGLGLMALPTVFQMFFGRPKLDLGEDEYTGPDGKSLFITVKNRPIKNRFLKFIRVVREVGDVSAFFDIQQQGSNLFVAKDISGSLHNSALRESGLMVRAFPGRTIGLTVIHFEKGTAYVVDARAQGGFKELPEGDYVVNAVIFCGEQIYKIKKLLKVGKEAHLTFWVL
ncbi:MAG: hypothetical protein ACLPL5_07665 [Stellaceae bacterium]